MFQSLRFPPDADTSQQVLHSYDIFPQAAWEWCLDQDFVLKEVKQIQLKTKRSFKVLTLNKMTDLARFLRLQDVDAKRGLGAGKLLLSGGQGRAVAVALPPFRTTSSKTDACERGTVSFNYCVVPEDGLVMFPPSYNYSLNTKIVMAKYCRRLVGEMKAAGTSSFPTLGTQMGTQGGGLLHLMLCMYAM